MTRCDGSAFLLSVWPLAPLVCFCPDAGLFDTLLPVDELLGSLGTVFRMQLLTCHIAPTEAWMWISRGTWRRASPWSERLGRDDLGLAADD